MAEISRKENMPNDLFNQIYGNAQNYAQELRTGMPALPAPPQISQDVSQYTKILGDIAQGDRAQSSVKGMVGAAQEETSYQEKLRAAAEANAKAAKAAKKENIRRVRKDDGGFDFYDENNQLISAYEYANLADKDISEVLADSMNPEDDKLLNDYEGMKEFWAAANFLDAGKGDAKQKLAAKQAMKSYEKDNPGISKMSQIDVLKRFRQKWGAAFGMLGR